MIDDSHYTRLLETSWRRKLTDSEEIELREWLAVHPDAQADWEAEAGLNEALGTLPEAPVASNFNERLLQAIELEQRAESRRRVARWWRRFVPRLALACALAAAGLFSYRHFHERERVRAEVAKGLVTVSAAVAEAPSVPNPEILDDFDVIRLSPWLYADEKLLTLLK